MRCSSKQVVLVEKLRPGFCSCRVGSGWWRGICRSGGRQGNTTGANTSPELCRQRGMASGSKHFRRMWGRHFRCMQCGHFRSITGRHFRRTRCRLSPVAATAGTEVGAGPSADRAASHRSGLRWHGGEEASAKGHRPRHPLACTK